MNKVNHPFLEHVIKMIIIYRDRESHRCSLKEDCIRKQIVENSNAIGLKSFLEHHMGNLEWQYKSIVGYCDDFSNNFYKTCYDELE